MIKSIELTMNSGKTFFLISTEDEKYTHSSVNAMLRGKSNPSIKVHTSNDIDSDVVYINPFFIESFKMNY